MHSAAHNVIARFWRKVKREGRTFAQLVQVFETAGLDQRSIETSTFHDIATRIKHKEVSLKSKPLIRRVLDICYSRHGEEVPILLLGVSMSTINYAFLIVHCKEFSNQSIGPAVIDVTLCARRVVEAFTLICASAGSTIPHSLTLSFRQTLTDYIAAFNQWKEVDKKALVRRTRLSLLSLYAHKHENIADSALSADFEAKIVSVRGILLKMEGEDHITIFDACRKHTALALIDDSDVRFPGYELQLPLNDELIFELLVNPNFLVSIPDDKMRRQEHWTRIGLRQPGGHRMIATSIFSAIKTLAVLVNDMKTATFPPANLVLFLNLEHQPQETLTWPDVLAMAVDAAVVLSGLPQASPAAEAWPEVHKQAMGLHEKQAFFHVFGFLMEVAFALRLHRVNNFVRSFARDIDTVGVRLLREIPVDDGELICTRAWLIDAIAAEDMAVLDRLTAPTNPAQHYLFTRIQTLATLSLISSPKLWDQDTLPETLRVEWRHIRSCTLQYRGIARRMALIVTATHSPLLKNNGPLLDSVCSAIMEGDVDRCCTASLVEGLGAALTVDAQQKQIRRAFGQCMNPSNTVYTLM